MTRKNMKNEERRRQMIEAGVKIATEKHPDLVTGAAIAEICGVTTRLVYHYLGSNEKIRERVKAEIERSKDDE